MLDILKILANDDSEHAINYSFNMLTRACNGLLKKWGSSIANTRKDPARTLLHALVMEDRTSILMNLVNSYNRNMVPCAFTDFPDVWNSSVHYEEYTTREIAMAIDQVNQRFDHRGFPSHPRSMALQLWARWLEGDRSVEENLMHAIASRFWRISSEHTRNMIRGIALYAHAHLFYNIGWNPETKVHDLPAANTDRTRMMIGASLQVTSERTFTEGLYEQQAGSLVFGCIPRVPINVCENTGLILEESRTLNPRENMNLPMDSFGDDGIAIRSTFDGAQLEYFLMYPEEYENGALLVWNCMN